MKTVIRRLCQLEKSVVPAIDYERVRLANEIGERRRRRLEASGQPFEEVRLTPTPGPYRAYADSLRSILQERRKRTSQAGEQP